MFKNLLVYRIGPGWDDSLQTVSDRLETARFEPCGATQAKSFGWVEPRGEPGAALAEGIDGHWILRFRIETKVVPGSVVNRKLDERRAQIEAESGRRPGKKESRELKEAITLELLPMAFSKLATVTVWIDRRAGLLMLDATSQSTIDDVVTSLLKLLPGLAIVPLATRESPAACMASWLVSQQAPSGFSIDRECELKATDDTKAVVRYSRHALDIDEIRGHIEQGKQPTRLAMTWNDRVSFVLNEQMQPRKVSFLEGVFDDAGVAGEEGFDADVAIATGELSRMIPDVVEALGGEAPNGPGAAAGSAPESSPGARPPEAVRSDDGNAAPAMEEAPF
ncbi:MAG: recombination-associated protein RdgC [Burkholderiaceae bacterium]